MAEKEQLIQSVVLKETSLFSRKPLITFSLTSESVSLLDSSPHWEEPLWEDTLTKLSLTDLDDVVVVNKHSESKRHGAYGGRRGLGMWSSSGTSRTIGDLVFMSRAQEIFRISQVRDPYGLKTLILSTKKQNKVVKSQRMKS